MTHCQCQLRRGTQYQVSWLPEKYAVIGKYLKLRDEDGWEVMAVFSAQDSEYIQERSTDYRYQRRASDI